MNKLKCEDCGMIFDENMQSCPNCGCPKSECLAYEEPALEETPDEQPKTESRQEIHTVEVKKKILPQENNGEKDYAHYIYECGVIFWNSLTCKFFSFSGRSSRREYWSFFVCAWLFLIPTYIGVFIAIIPALAVSIRRIHDIGKSGWWSIVPVANLFLSLKKSDKGLNEYGEPCDYTQILS